MQLIRNGEARHGTTIFALEQTQGKGQRGRSWESNSGENIMLSVIIDAKQHKLLEQFAFSATIALGCHDFFSHFAGDETTIKWPNDLYWRDRKAGGMLIENILSEGNWKWSVIGVGININQTDFQTLQNRPVSLKQITGKHFDTIDLARELCACLEKRFMQLITHSTENIVVDYNEHLFKKGQLVKFKKGQVVFEATVSKVNDHGALEIEHGFTDTVRHGEVEWLL